MGKIGVYGGTFNPPHAGHSLAVQEMIRALDLDRVLLVPAAVPPHKALAAGSPGPQLRLQMLRLAAAGLPKVEVDDQELRREGPQLYCGYRPRSACPVSGRQLVPADGNRYVPVF